MKTRFALIALSLSGTLLAQSGADALLEATGEELAPTEKTTILATETSDQKFKLTDPFLQALFVEWKASDVRSFEVNRWMSLILNHDFKAASHLWSSVQTHLPSQLIPLATATWAYLTWKLDLPQTFISAWKEAKVKANGSRPWLALERTLSENQSAHWIENKMPFIDATFAQDLATQNSEGFSLELAAWAMRNNVSNAYNVLQKLPLGHPRSIDLATSAVLNYARERKLGEAGKLLKRRVEPELKKIGDAKLLARHYLALGRLLYQSGALEAAEAFYAKVPRGMEEFLPARTERTWVLLRLGRVNELRGELESLSHKVLSDRFLPEVSLVRSISNLKLCRYDEVAKDFNFFIENNQKWVKLISSSLASPEASSPDIFDHKISSLNKALKLREIEEMKLSQLAIESVKAALPAVGEQPHWLKARSAVMSDKAEMKRNLNSEKRRFWKNREIILTEAIRKMRFVKIEAMSQMRTIAESIGRGDVISTVQAASGKQSYPFEGVYWPDELFTLQAKAQTLCGGKK